jgi:hypothetical protein
MRIDPFFIVSVHFVHFVQFVWTYVVNIDFFRTYLEIYLINCLFKLFHDIHFMWVEMIRKHPTERVKKKRKEKAKKKKDLRSFLWSMHKTLGGISLNRLNKFER